MRVDHDRFRHDVNFIRRVGLLLIILLSLSLNAYSDTDQETIQNRLHDYQQAYTDIEFVLIDSAEDYGQLLPLTESLGEDVSNLDYQHPDTMRQELVEVQQYRIGVLLDSGSGSSTLFKTPNAKITSKPYSCLITLNQSLLDNNPLAATSLMYGLDEQDLAAMPVELHIDNDRFLLYMLDHEVFHCVDGYMNGYLYPQTSDPLKADRDRSVAELRTEIFAAMAHLTRNPGDKRLLNNLSRARTLGLLDWDVEHYTSAALQQLMRQAKAYEPDIKSLARQAMDFAEGVTPSFEDHVSFLVAAWAVVQEHGLVMEDIPADYATLPQYQPDPARVRVISDDLDKVITAINYQD